MIKPAINGCSMPHPVTMQAPLASQTRASGVPISQNVHQRAIWPVANFINNFIDCTLAAAIFAVATVRPHSTENAEPQFHPLAHGSKPAVPSQERCSQQRTLAARLYLRAFAYLR